ncbi:GNAT family N-acetyltransferase [Sulfitobacter guttiformis]|uniref:Acetyltransferase (GNAT) family protein n=1 Tax=Sulfitobacter guttiformis TaxID=74349 RepID=A0A420DQU7_9RHOB|nr:GNAT family N-acetyltransferase [Sulfitobacter guttiformis]KIN74002.1 GCN5-related N-acetyltransferase [Sulfitobacter guttiformis KCTC 32187]RKE96625.1 acetyltransferase (GNAT) family protein [Sulfitobacter guttiformis]
MVEVTFATPAQRDEVEAFMHAAFPRAKWGAEGWTRLLANRWGGPQGEFAVTARDGDKLVGVMGMNDSLRHTPRGPQRYRNLTSWYVLKSHRGMGLGETLMHTAMGDPAVTSTNLTSAKAALPLVDRIGFRVLDAQRFVWRHSGLDALPHTFDPLKDANLRSVDAQVLKDHTGLGLGYVTVETPDGLCTLVLSVKQKVDEYITHEVVYVGQPDLLARHGDAIANTVLPQTGAVFSVDSRLATGARPGTVETIEVPRFYKGNRMLPAEIDHMYSEIVLMGMKLY